MIGPVLAALQSPRVLLAAIFAFGLIVLSALYLIMAHSYVASVRTPDGTGFEFKPSATAPLLSPPPSSPK